MTNTNDLKNQSNMKKIYFPMLVAMILVTSCQMKTKTAPVDPATSKAEITKTLENMDAALNSRDVKTFLSFLTEDGLYCGTDPSEMWDKAGLSKAMTAMLADTTSTYAMNYDKKEIRLSKDENSANVLQQFTTKWSKPLQLRQTLHMVKVDNKWMVDFSSFAVIPENKDISKITAALMK